MKCPKCGSENTIGVEYYNVGLPAVVGYDGISEIQCQDCNTRSGRWSLKTLKEGELEGRFGAGTPIKK